MNRDPYDLLTAGVLLCGDVWPVFRRFGLAYAALS